MKVILEFERKPLQEFYFENQQEATDFFILAAKGGAHNNSLVAINLKLEKGKKNKNGGRKMD